MSDLTPSQEAAEERLLSGADELLKEATTGAPAEEDFADVEDSRFEARVDVPDEEEEEEESAADPETSPAGQWTNTPSVRDQALNHPDTVRAAEPVTMIIDPQDEKQLQKLNDIQKAAASDAPTLTIVENERKFFEGKWSVYLTYCRVEYLKI